MRVTIKPLIAVALVLICGHSASVAGSTVNTESLRDLSGKVGWGGFAQLDLLARTGNEDLFQAGAGFRLQHIRLLRPDDPRSLDWSAFLVAHLNRGSKSDERFIDNGFAHARWTKMWWRATGTETFAQYQFNGFTRLERRVLLGENVRLVVLENTGWEAHAATGAMFEFETLSAGIDAGSSTRIRWNNYVTLKYGRDAGGSVQAAFTIYFQPLFEDLKDFRLLGENEIQVILGSGLSWVVGLNIAYDSRPPEGIQRMDTQISHRLRFAF